MAETVARGGSQRRKNRNGQVQEQEKSDHSRHMRRHPQKELEGYRHERAAYVSAANQAENDTWNKTNEPADDRCYLR